MRILYQDNQLEQSTVLQEICQQASPPLIVMPRAWFQLCTHQPVPALDQMNGLWNVRCANETHLAPVMTGVDGATNTRARKAMPVGPLARKCPAWGPQHTAIRG